MGGWFRITGMLVVAVFLVTQVRACLRSDEDLIIGLIADAEDGWNDARASDTVAPLADDFVLVPFHQGKPWLQEILFIIYRHNRDPKSGEFLYHAVVDWQSVKLEFVDPEYAQVRGGLKIERTDGREDWDYDGAFGIEARKRDGEWQIVSAGLKGLGQHRARGRRPKGG
jgi:hypothetical protein